MTDRLHQVNVTYAGKEDRLLLRATTQEGAEYRIWLTRRFTVLLFNILNKAMEKHGGAPAIGSSEQTKQMLKAGAFEKGFEEGKTTNYPLSENGFLAFGIKTANTPEGNLYLEILPEKGPGVKLNLDKQLLYMLQNLLSQGVARADWQINTSLDNTSQQVH